MFGTNRFELACKKPRCSEPLPLDRAKAAAKTLLTTKCKSEPRDWFRELDQIAANEVDQAYRTREKRTWPLDVMGGQRHAEMQSLMIIEKELRLAILDTERVLKDDEPKLWDVTQAKAELEYYTDGYPKLPASLDRRPKPPLEKAA